MKRIFSLLLCTVIIFSAFSSEAFAVSDTKKTSEILIRDPFVLVHDGKYYMYGTGCSRGPGYGCYVSDDLENWSGPFQVFTPPQGHTGDGCWWAPECHEYKGSFYLFATYYDKAVNHRGVAIFKSSSPLGPFEQISNGFITPAGQDSIDGTLYVDPSGQPWMVFVREWTMAENEIGRMSVAKMSDDLTHFTSEPYDIFKATDARGGLDGKITDGPFLYTLKNGSLLMLWSNYGDDGYAVALAQSESIEGKWVQQNRLLFTKPLGNKVDDGGHGMIFTDLEGRLMLSIHSPNSSGEGFFEAAAFYEVVEVDGTLMLKSVYEKQQQITEKASTITSAVAKALSAFWAFIVSIFTTIF